MLSVYSVTMPDNFQWSNNLWLKLKQLISSVQEILKLSLASSSVFLSYFHTEWPLGIMQSHLLIQAILGSTRKSQLPKAAILRNSVQIMERRGAYMTFEHSFTGKRLRTRLRIDSHWEKSKKKLSRFRSSFNQITLNQITIGITFEHLERSIEETFFVSSRMTHFSNKLFCALTTNGADHPDWISFITNTSI